MSATASSALLEVDGLRTEIHGGRRTLTIVDGVSFRVEPRQTLALIGESGSGKTMTALSVLRLVGPPVFIAEGRAVYRDRDLLKLPDTAMRELRGKRLGMIFQNPRDRFDPVRSIAWQLMEVLLHHRVCPDRREARRRALALLEEARVANAGRVMDMYPNELSGGMLQRAMIAVAVAPSPDLLIADEPTSSLDVTIQSEILDLLQELQQARGMGIIFITHDISVAEQVADTVAVMYAGQIVEQGPAAEVLRAPRHPYTEALLASVPTAEGGRPRPIPGMVASLARLPPGCRFAPRCQRASEHSRAEQPPPLFEVGAGSTVRCWLFEPAPG